MGIFRYLFHCSSIQIWEHFNPYGRFDLDMNTRLALL
jgi:hypothetical protein